MARHRFYGFLLRYFHLLIFKRQTLGKVAEQMARRYGSEEFIWFENERISFEEFNRAANRRANLFMAMGVARGEVVALMMDNRPEFLTTLAGLSKLGAAAAAINTNLVGPALVHCLNLSGAAKIVVGAECVDRLAEALPQMSAIRPAGVFVDTRWPADTAAPAGTHNFNEMLAGASDAEPPPVALTSADLLMYIYTSGTTGLPKASRISHSRWYAGGLVMGYYALALEHGDRVYCALPLYHSNGSLIAFAAAAVNGCGLALSRRFSARNFWQEVTSLGATCFIYVGEVLRYLVNSPVGQYDRAHKVTRILGNGLRPDIWTAFQQRFGVAHIREFYLSTEGNAATLNLDDVPGSVGKDILEATSNLKVVRYDVETNTYPRDLKGFCIPSQPGEVGELLGAITFLKPFHGYTNPEETKKKVLGDVFRKGDLYFKTGDLVKQDEQGYFFFVDRIGDTFRWKGENVATQEVQEILAGYPGVQMISVYGVSIPGAEGRAGMAALMLETGQQFQPQAFYKYCQEKLASYARPAFVRLTSAMDMTGTFKLRKSEMQMVNFNPANVKDPLFFRDEAQAAYSALTPAVYQDIQTGRVRF